MFGIGISEIVIVLIVVLLFIGSLLLSGIAPRLEDWNKDTKGR